MLTKNELKYYSSLLQKKYRNSEKKFIVEGERIVKEGLNSNFTCEIVILSTEYSADHDDLEFGGIRTEIIDNNYFVKLSDTKTPQGIIGVFNKFEKSVDYNSNLIVALEDISDPGNLGTIIRTSDWFGVEQIFLSGDCTDLYSPKVLRSTMGSIFHIDVNEDEQFYESLAEMKSKGYEIICADMNGEDIYQFKQEDKTVIIFCSEAYGPSQKLLSLIDRRVTIPKLGKAESLNVASAAAVIISKLTG
ncbi:TrmH family RNA methyltransferase [Bacteroidota bacterium]